MSTSKLQRRVSYELSNHFGGYTIRENIRPEWMVDITGYRLELDFFIEELNVAIEVQGEQHYRYVPQFHNDAQGFSDQLQRDRLKKNACSKYGISLFEILDNRTLKNVIRWIRAIEQSRGKVYEPIDTDLDFALKSLDATLNTHNPGKISIEYAEMKFKKITKMIANNPTLLTDIHPGQAKHIIRFLNDFPKRLQKLKDQGNEAYIQKYFKKWSGGRKSKGGVRPPISEMVEWMKETGHYLS